MTHFQHLRTTPWEPSFEWVTTMAEAAHRINVWHEDHPRRVLGTKVLIQWLNGVDLDLSEAWLGETYAKFVQPTEASETQRRRPPR